MANDATDQQTINIDPRVALQEAQARAEALDTFYRNRCLVLGQTVFDLQVSTGDLQGIVEEQSTKLAELTGKAK